MLLIYYSYNVSFQPFLNAPAWPAIPSLTNSYVSPSGIALLNLCSEIYCAQFLIPRLSLGDTNVLQTHPGKHFDMKLNI
jgi:hypothetical protein